MTQPFDFSSSGRELIGTASRQVTSLRSKAAASAAAIIAAADPAAAMAEFFTAARGEYLAARASGRKAAASTLGRGWNALRSALAYHFGEASLSAKWPNWASGEGVCSLSSKADAAKAAAGKRAEREAADAAALAAWQAEQGAEQLAKLRSMGSADLARSLADQIVAWGGSPADVLADLADIFHADGFGAVRLAA
jgi:hypothetical protein